MCTWYQWSRFCGKLWWQNRDRKNEFATWGIKKLLAISIFFCGRYSLLQNFLVSVYFLCRARFQNSCPLHGDVQNTDPHFMDFPSNEYYWNRYLCIYIAHTLFIFFRKDWRCHFEYLCLMNNHWTRRISRLHRYTHIGQGDENKA